MSEDVSEVSEVASGDVSGDVSGDAARAMNTLARFAAALGFATEHDTDVA